MRRAPAHATGERWAHDQSLVGAAPDVDPTLIRKLAPLLRHNNSAQSAPSLALPQIGQIVSHQLSHFATRERSRLHVEFTPQLGTLQAVVCFPAA